MAKSETVHAEGGYKASVERGDAKKSEVEHRFVTLASASAEPVKRTAPSTRQIKTPAFTPARLARPDNAVDQTDVSPAVSRANPRPVVGPSRVRARRTRDRHHVMAHRSRL